MSYRVLGIDLGPNSIGWALIELPDDPSDTETEINPPSIIGDGARIFQEGVDRDNSGREVSKNETRRTARAMRRQSKRRGRRKQLLKQTLIAARLFPDDETEQQKLLSTNPYPLRAKALLEPLAPHEIGRVFYALNQRRGFLSNRKTDRKNKKETEGMLAEISELAEKIEDGGHATLGQHLAAELKSNRKNYKGIRGQHTLRSMYIDEFHKIWEFQQPHHPELLTPELRRTLCDPTEDENWVHKGIIFGQRKMYWDKKSIGKCELELGEYRCERAGRLAQKYRLFQEVNNLRLIEGRDERTLTEEERTTLIQYLMSGKERKFVQICKKLGLNPNVRFNLEAGNRQKLLGMVTDAELANKNIFGRKKWDNISDEEQTEIVRFLLDHDHDERAVQQKAINDWGLNEAEIDRLLSVNFPSGMMNFSRKAIQKLLPHLEAGMLLMTNDGTPCAMKAAGYLRPDQRTVNQKEFLPSPPDLPNPIARQALYEVQHLVNAIIREYRTVENPIPFDAIHIELARDVRGSLQQRLEAAEQMREREAERDKAADWLRDQGYKVNRENINRYLLWIEQHKECIYSGNPISPRQLFGGEVDIDHILPRSRSLDNSQMNKVVCFRYSNSSKGNRTPYECLAETDSEEYEKLLQRAAKLPYRKRKRFSQKTIETDQFIARQLRDTSYITRKVTEYVRCLGCDVLGTKGQLVSVLRHEWGLDWILDDKGTGIKNRDDHRHHAVDAIVIALLNRKRLITLSNYWKQKDHWEERDEPQKRVTIPLPWKDFRQDVEKAVNAINVSQRVSRKVSGALHKETIYGKTDQSGMYVRRKPLSSLTNTSQIKKIRDTKIREIVREHIRTYDIDPDKKAKIPAAVWKGEPKMPSGVPIRKVRMVEESSNMFEVRLGQWVEPGGNHHVEILELLDDNGKPISQSDGLPKREGFFVTRFDAAQRVKKKEPIIKHDHGPDKKFVMSLSINEMFLLDVGEDKLVLHRVQKMSKGQIILRPHTYAGKVSDSDKPPLIQRRTPNSLRGKKVTVDRLGQIRTAND